MPIKQIAQLGISKNTVKANLAPRRPHRGNGGRRPGRPWTRWSRRSAGCRDADDAGDGDRGAGSAGPGGMTVLTGWVQELRPVYLLPDPSVAAGVCGRGRSRRTIFWFPDIEPRSAMGSPAPRPVAGWSARTRVCFSPGQYVRGRNKLTECQAFRGTLATPGGWCCDRGTLS